MCKISIVIVCKNEKIGIRRTVESVLAQKYENWECIVIDGASQDGTLEILNDMKDKDARLSIYSEDDEGIYDAMNKGIRRAQGEYIYFLNAKDELFNEHVLSEVSQRLDDNNPEIFIGAVCKKCHMGRERNVFHVTSEERMLNNLQHGASVCHQAIFAKKDCLLEGFNLSYMIAADYDWLCKQVVVYKRKILIANEPIAYFEGYGVSSLAKSWKRMREEGDEIHHKYFGNYEEENYQKNRLSQYKVNMIEQIILEWLILRQRGGNIENVLKKHGVHTVAVYGMAKLGYLLYQELIDTEISMKYTIDRRNLMGEIEHIANFNPKDELPQVDAVIITPILDYYEIKENMKRKMDCQYFSLEDLINEAFDELEKSAGENNVI